MKQTCKCLSIMARIALICVLVLLGYAALFVVGVTITFIGGYAVGHAAYALFGWFGWFANEVGARQLFAGMIGLFAFVAIPPLLEHLFCTLGKFLMRLPSVQRLERAFKRTGFGCWLLGIEPPLKPIAPPQQGFFRTNATKTLQLVH